MYKVVKANLETHECYFILKDDLPCYNINRWLEYKGNKSLATSKRYAYNLMTYLNYIKSYTEVTTRDIEEYIKYLLYNRDGVLTIDAQISYNTLKSHIITIKEFYKYLDYDKYEYIWNMDTDILINHNVLRRYSNKEYIKWYTDSEIHSIVSNFLTLRDEAVFRLTLEGFRIDEVLSMTVQSYNDIEGTICPTRSKNNALRTLKIKDVTRTALDNYIFMERDSIETYTDYLFVNLNKGKYQGYQLAYRNYIRILKGAADRANIDPELIRTHSGRSTRTMELLHHQAETGLTDEQIRLLMGWSSTDSITPYINYQDDRILLKIARKI